MNRAMRVHLHPFRILWLLLTVVLALTCFYLHKKNQDILWHSRQLNYVCNYSCSNLPYSRLEVDALYSQTSQQALQISHELWHMGRAISNASSFRDQLEDASIQLEARLAVMNELIGESERRRARLIYLGKLLESQLNQLQNPWNCNTAKFIVTELPNCGFGCQVHHVAMVFHMAFALNRTLYVKSDNWFDMFYPVTNCTHIGEDRINQPILRGKMTLGQLAPPGLRQDWAEALRTVHQFPYAWFRGNLIRYILRFKPTAFQKKLHSDLEKINTRPLVGVHIRRTDKLLSEAKYFPLSRYMANVERVYQRFEIQEELMPQREREKIQRIVILASDNVDVFKEARLLYPDYNFIGDENRGNYYWTRNLKRGLENIIYDIYSLANCDFVVCTFSSNVCRLVYELLLTDLRFAGDRTTHVQSIDNIYTMHGQRQRTWTVLGSAIGSDFRKGDIVVLSKNHWNGSVETADGKVLPAYMVQEDILRLPDH